MDSVSAQNHIFHGRVEIIVKNSQSIRDLEDESIQVEELLGGFSILTLPVDEIENIVKDRRVIQVDLSKPMVLNSFEENLVSCVTQVKEGENALHGEGVLIAIIDSGERVIIMSS